MYQLSVRTKGNANPTGLPRVYFTCHPKDFGRYFDKVCKDIFKSTSCAIYYLEDMSMEISEDYVETDLGRMNLFVMPVTFRLLTQPNRAMEKDFRFAMDHHIPVLPFMMETGIDSFYSRKDRFGELQYLSPYDQDPTSLPYEVKLKNYLQSVLVDDETAKRIRAAFDAYIFLSYRKKDRKYANELMRMIHANPICRDIAIWYDEYLAPGESFNTMIQQMLVKSDLFALLVTPNLVNEENYIRKVEYPTALEAGKKILPVEMEETDPIELKEQYQEIPGSVTKGPKLDERLMEIFHDIAIQENDNDPTHNYLIGLAYLEGIDVEKDTERGLELVQNAAENELMEAMIKLAKMYRDGQHVPLDYRKELAWRGRIVAYCQKEYGEEHPTTLVNLNNMAITYDNLGDYQKAAELMEKVCDLRCRILGEGHPSTLAGLRDLAIAYSNLGDYQKKADLEEKVYEINCRIFGEEHPNALRSLYNLSTAYLYLGDYQKAATCEEKLYELRCRVLGKDHPDTQAALNTLNILRETIQRKQNENRK